MLRLLSEVLIRPMINIIQSWENILNGNIVSASKNNERTTVDRYRKDKRNIENDWRRVNQDMWRLFKK